MFSDKFKKGFTLAEIMIVLTVIGVISAIIFPVATQSIPDKNRMKFKRGNTILYSTIQTLVRSDKYYKNKDLGMRPDGTLINGKHTGDETYFCQTFADVIATKSVNCGTNTTDNGIVCSDWNADKKKYPNGEIGYVDSACKTNATKIGEEIITPDGIVFYEIFTGTPFGWDQYLKADNRLFTETLDATADGTKSYKEKYDLDEPISAYRCKRVFCMDVDGIGKGEDPFGYGIRVDGKILPGLRAQQWANQNLNDN